MAKLSGVIKVAAMVAIAVRLTERATFPFAIAVIKFEMLPPGQAAIKIIPNATVGVGLSTRTNRKVTKGNRKNCEITPIRADFGFMNTSLKCWIFMSKATPNIIKAIVTFKANSPEGEKFNRTLSRTSKASFTFF